jgi:hypothetical protein
VLGVGETANCPVVLANLGGARRIGVQTDVLGEDLVAVFIPNSPNALSGGVFLVPVDSVRRAAVPLGAAMGALRRCGRSGDTAELTRSGRANLIGFLTKAIHFRSDVRIGERPLAVDCVEKPLNRPLVEKWRIRCVSLD